MNGNSQLWIACHALAINITVGSHNSRAFRRVEVVQVFSNRDFLPCVEHLGLEAA